MVEAGQHLRFALETSPRLFVERDLGAKELYGTIRSTLEIGGAIDDAHSAGSDALIKAVATLDHGPDEGIVRVDESLSIELTEASACGIARATQTANAERSLSHTVAHIVYTPRVYGAAVLTPRAMRITGGKLRGQTLKAPEARGVRPSADRVREAVGSILAARDAFAGARVLDLFAGSGAYGFEALSRGASSVVAVDRLPLALQTIQSNARRLGVTIDTQRADLLGSPARSLAMLASYAPFDLVFVDPPYEEIEKLPSILDSFTEQGILQQGALLVVEGPSVKRPPDFEHLAPLRVYRYGDTQIALFVNEGKRKKDS